MLVLFIFIFILRQRRYIDKQNQLHVCRKALPAITTFRAHQNDHGKRKIISARHEQSAITRFSLAQETDCVGASPKPLKIFCVPGREVRNLANPHQNVRIGSCGNGDSALATASYVLRKGKYVERQEGELAAQGMLRMPSWVDDDCLRYWDAADRNERNNGVLFYEFKLALPKELNLQQQKALIEEFAASVSAAPQDTGPLPAVWAIHGNVDKDLNCKNPHAHLLLSPRGNDGMERQPERWFSRANRNHPERGGALKTRHMKPKAWLLDVRKEWAATTNRHLEAAGSTARIDHRSLKDQGIDRESEAHLGPFAARNPQSRLAKLNKKIQQDNHKRTECRRRLDELARLDHTPGVLAPEWDERVYAQRYKANLLSKDYQERISEILERQLRFVQRTSKYIKVTLITGGEVVDHGNYLEATELDQASEIATLLAIAKAKGWKQIEITGPPDFRRAVWLDALASGDWAEQQVLGYEPNEEDLTLAKTECFAARNLDLPI